MVEYHSRYFFEHLLTCEAAYQSLLASNRAKLHSLSANELAGQFVAGSQDEWEILPQLAWHLQAAGRFAEAHERNCQLLQLFAQTGRLDRWDSCLARAQECWAQQRARFPEAAEQSCSLLQALAARQYSAGHFDEALELLSQALSLAEQAREASVVAAVRIATGAALHRVGRNAEANLQYEQALALLEAGDDLLTQCQLHRAIGVLRRDEGNGADSTAHSQRALELARQLGNRRLEGVILISMANAESIFGSMVAAKEAFEQALVLMEQVGDLDSQATCLAALSEAFAILGDYPASDEYGRQALAICRSTGNRRTLFMALMNVGRSLQHQARYLEARDYFNQSLELSDAMQYRFGWSMATYFAAGLDLVEGRPQDARQRITEGLSALSGSSRHFFEIPALRVLAEAELALGNPEAAMQALQRRDYPEDSYGSYWNFNQYMTLCRTKLALGDVEAAGAYFLKTAAACAEFAPYPLSEPQCGLRELEADFQRAGQPLPQWPPA